MRRNGADFTIDLRRAFSFPLVSIAELFAGRVKHCAGSMPIETEKLFGVTLHRVTMSETVALLLAWMTEDRPCRYVVTPNVDHVVKLQSHPAMREAYQDAALAVADGWPLVTASRWLGRPLPERVAGSDLVPNLLAAGQNIPGFRVFLLGAAPGVGIRAAENIRARWPRVNVCGAASPRFGFDSDPKQCEDVVDGINAAKPHLLVVGLGAPAQEIWLSRYAPQLDAQVAIAAGATIDFLAGVQRRAPYWVQQARLEWLFRLVTNPRRLAGRYARDAVVFPRLVASEWRRIRAETAHQV
jgi:N-acetylglucosaminyldiphosphoundecaprenol N-acetyl-beta-D-mannosaminyltransferase